MIGDDEMRKMNFGDSQTLTYDKMLLSVAQFGYGGMKVVVSDYLQPVPRIELSTEFKWCSEGFREKQNQWLLKMFGAKDVAYMMNDDIIMTPIMASELSVVKFTD